MKEELKTLWKNTFGDSDSYIEFFFTHIFKEENVLFYRKEGKIVSALHLIPYPMIYHNQVVTVSYICGVATVPEERGKGLMASLMEEAHRESKKRGDAFTVLIPANPGLFSYYRKMGYFDLFFYESFEYKSNEWPKEKDSGYHFFDAKDVSTRQLFDLFDLQLRKRETGILHTFEDFLFILQEMELSGGFLKLLVTPEKEVTGMAFIYPSAEAAQFLIKELIYIDDSVKKILLEKIAGILPDKKLIVRQPVETGKAIPFGMACEINRQEKDVENSGIGFMSLMLE